MDIKKIRGWLSQLNGNENVIKNNLEQNRKIREKILEELAKAPMPIEEFLVDENVVNNMAITKEMNNAFYDTIGAIPKGNAGALLIYIMDTTGSMGIWEKFLAKAYYIWTRKILLAKHGRVETAFIGHDTEATVYDSEQDLFNAKSTGGTISSKGIIEAAKIIISEKFNDNRDIYVIYASDGDNLTSDNSRVVKILKEEILTNVSLFNYFEVNAYNRYSTLAHTMKYITNSFTNFSKSNIKGKDELLTHLKSFKDKL